MCPPVLMREARARQRDVTTRGEDKAAAARRLLRQQVKAGLLGTERSPEGSSRAGRVMPVGIGAGRAGAEHGHSLVVSAVPAAFLGVAAWLDGEGAPRDRACAQGGGLSRCACIPRSLRRKSGSFGRRRALPAVAARRHGGEAVESSWPCGSWARRGWSRSGRLAGCVRGSGAARCGVDAGVADASQLDGDGRRAEVDDAAVVVVLRVRFGGAAASEAVARAQPRDTMSVASMDRGGKRSSGALQRGEGAFCGGGARD